MKAVAQALAWLLVVLCCLPAQVARSEHAAAFSGKVLLLHSYHAGFPWTDEIQAGVLAEFRRQDPNFEPYVEFLDWKRFPSKENLDTLAQALALKHAGRRFDVIITSDNAALLFALNHRADLFGDAPIVFCGLNGFTDALIAGHGQVTGVTEEMDAEGSLKAALTVFPDLKRVYCLLEDTESGLAERREIVTAARAFQGRFEVVFLDNASLEETFRFCGPEQSGEAILLLGSFGRDRAGRIYPDFAVDILSAACSVPVFVMWDFLMGKGAFGGSVLSGKLQGREAGRLALRVLSGERDIPVTRTPPTLTMFDHDQLRRFGVPTSVLPRDSLLVNEPVSLLDRHRQAIPVVVASMAIMAGAIVALSFSVLARRRAERNLERAQAMLSAIIDQSPAGIMVAEAPDVTLAMANPEAVRIMGIRSEAGQNASYLREGDIDWICRRPDGEPYKTSELALPRTIVDGAEIDNVEMRVTRHDGLESWILLSGRPIRNRHGEIIAGMVVFSDISARKRMEDMVIQSEKMVSLGGLAAGMAHEINNPLGIIVHSAQNALRRISPGLPANEAAAAQAGVALTAVHAYLEARHIPSYLADIVDAGHRAARIVRSMLNFSRPRGTQRAPLRVRALLDKAVELAQSDWDLKKDYDIKKVRFTYDDSAQDPSGHFVETELVQVFLNIVKNACQAMASKRYPEGQEPEVRFDVRVDGEDIVAEIRDNGPGMDEKTCRRVMEPFFTTKKVGEGTGLGLSVSYFIVTNSYGGALDVCSEPGEGTTFTVRLPRGRA
ncbi:Sporulation kinase A [Fundidesulfovibrio magnetotacticus]|uniref:histidine kinase n=1 Tax=Fundidesulfovibrio magnetotacticus TaxID=2730080 RepID=A0A6V8LRL8_9BACT|nr:ATP-binding protein [Fundidesulfovibrio magnetotacticus]GFK93201.1 Sporulation kinase A [Fundidesulfovibrio magnetotacticus]